MGERCEPVSQPPSKPYPGQQERRWTIPICSSCGGIFGWRGTPAGCTCDPTHTKLGRSIEVMPVSDHKAQLEGAIGEERTRREAAERERDELKEPGRFIPLDSRTHYEKSLERSLDDAEAERDAAMGEFAERLAWELERRSDVQRQLRFEADRHSTAEAIADGQRVAFEQAASLCRSLATEGGRRPNPGGKP